MCLPQAASLVRLVAALAVGLFIAACGPAHSTRPAGQPGLPASSTGEPPTASYRDGTLLLRYGANGDRQRVVAHWPTVDDVPADSHSFRAARFELLDKEADKDVDLGAAQPLPIHSRAEWDDVVTQVLHELAPTGEGEAALTLVQGQEIVFYVTPAHELRIHRHEEKPVDRRVTHFVGEGEFAARADDVIRKRFGGNDVLLFRTGDESGDESFVFFDLPRRQSVLITGPSPEQRGDLANALNTLVRVPDTLILRGQALGILTRPVSSAVRLVWFASQSALKLVPPHYDEHDETPPPVVARPGMDLRSWEDELDRMGISPAYRGSIAPLIDGEAFFTHLVQAVQEARKSIAVRLFIFDNDDYAMRIADLLKQRSREVRVRVLIDALGTLGASQAAPDGAATEPRPFSIADYLRADSQVEVRETPNPWLLSDHTKAILVDRRLAYVGGMNIGHEYRHDWHDMMVALEGPIVGRLQHDFDIAWAYAGFGGDLAYLQALGSRETFVGDAERPDYVDLRPIYTRTLDPQLLRVQVAAIRRARDAIWVEQPYVSDDSLVGALIDARARGVDVRMIVPTRGDSQFMNSANLLAASVLVRNGVRVYVYPGMTHVKAALYDGWACLGSANFDKLSLRVNQETNVATSDPAFVEKLRRDLFEADFARSRELTEPPTAGWGTYITAYVAGQL
jgi:cardiolipin synthase